MFLRFGSQCELDHTRVYSKDGYGEQTGNSEMDIENPKAVPRFVIGILLYLSELYVIACG
jgi:hypothetical protein